MKDYVFYRGKKITWFLVISYLLTILRNVIVPYNESARYSKTYYTSSVVLTICFYTLITALIIYKSVAIYKISNKSLRYGNIFKKEMFFSRIVEIKSTEKYITFTSIEGNKRVSCNISTYILFNNIDLYKDFFAELVARIDIDDIEIDYRTRAILNGQKLITIEGLNTPKPRIGGWLLYITIGNFSNIYLQIVALSRVLFTISTTSMIEPTQLIITIVGSAILIIINVIAIIYIFKRKKITPKILIAKEWINLFLVSMIPIATVVAALINSSKLELYVYVTYILGTGNTILMALIYARYYKTSIRIKKTFGLMSDQEYKKIYGDYSVDDASREMITRTNKHSEDTANEAISKSVKLKRELRADDFAKVKEYLDIYRSNDCESKITIMFFGKVNHNRVKDWYKEIKDALSGDFLAINKIFASPDIYDKKYANYKPSDEYEKIYIDQVLTQEKGKKFKTLGFLCEYIEANDGILDSFCFGDMSWGSDVYSEGMKISFDIKTASEIDIFKYIEIYSSFISLFHIHVFEIDYRKGVTLKKYNNDFVEYNKSKNVILDIIL